MAGDDAGLQVTLKTYSWKEPMAEEGLFPRTGDIGEELASKTNAVETGRDGLTFSCSQLWP